MRDRVAAAHVRGAPRSSLLRHAADHAVERDRSGTAYRDPQEQEAVEHRVVGAGGERKDPPIEVKAPVKLQEGDGHLSRREERGRAREQPERDERAGDELDEAADPQLREHLGRVIDEDAEELLDAVTQKHRAGDDPQRGEDDRGELLAVDSLHCNSVPRYERGRQAAYRGRAVSRLSCDDDEPATAERARPGPVTIVELDVAK